jgi:hypothetical protein
LIPRRTFRKLSWFNHKVSDPAKHFRGVSDPSKYISAWSDRVSTFSVNSKPNLKKLGYDSGIHIGPIMNKTY